MHHLKFIHSIPKLLLALAVLASLLQPETGASAEGDSLPKCRIMPLGDSITAGSSSGTVPANDPNYYISYRKTLRDNLVLPGYEVDYVGGLSGGSAVFGDPQHEGHGGWKDDEVAAAIYDWLTAHPPYIVLLHIGTNGLSASPDDVEDILDEIDRFESNSGDPIWVVLARIIDRIPNHPTTNTFNNNVQAMAQARISAGDKIVIVDMEDGAGIVYDFQPDGDMSDSLHPFSKGYNKMAAVWEAAIEQLPGQACNNPPSITTSLPDREDPEGSLMSINVDASDAEGNSLTFGAANLPSGLNIDPVSGEISGSLSYQASASSPYTTTVTVTDTASNKKDIRSFTWTVMNANGPPLVTQPPNQSHVEGAMVNLQIVASDPDGDLLTFSQAGLPPGLYLDASSGLISGTVGYDAYTGMPYTVQVTATDNGSPPKNDSKTFSWTVSNTNRPPLVTQPADQSHAEGEAVNLQIVASDPDGDSLTFSQTGLPSGLSLDPGSGLITGTISYEAYTGTPYIVQVTATDNGSPVLSASQTFTWTVSDVNRPPQVSQPPDQLNGETEPVNLQIQASDPDLNDSLGYGLDAGSQLPDGLQIDPENGLISGVISSGTADGSPYTVTVVVTDNGSPPLSSSVTFKWNVEPYNNPPVVSNPGDQINQEGESVLIDISASDPDEDTLNFSATGLPPGLSINGTTGRISGIIALNAYTGSPYLVTVTATDNGVPAKSDSVTFSYTILDFTIADQNPVYLPVVIR